MASEMDRDWSTISSINSVGRFMNFIQIVNERLFRISGRGSAGSGSVSGHVIMGIGRVRWVVVCYDVTDDVPLENVQSAPKPHRVFFFFLFILKCKN